MHEETMEDLLFELCEYIFDIDDLGNYSHPLDNFLDEIAQKINKFFDDEYEEKQNV